MLNAAVIKVGAVAFATVLFGYVCYNRGYASADNEHKLKASQEQVSALLEYQEQTNRMYAQLAKARAERDAANARTDSKLHAAIDSLRNRPSRPAGVSEAPRAACEGANGAELARDDSVFLARFAALAAKQDAALAECYATIDSAQRPK